MISITTTLLEKRVVALFYIYLRINFREFRQWLLHTRWRYTAGTLFEREVKRGNAQSTVLDCRPPLIAMRAQQIAQLHQDRHTASDRTMRSRQRAAAEYAEKNKGRLISGEYKPDELVIVSQKRLTQDGQYKKKSDELWAGPYKIHELAHGGSYKLKELDGAIMHGTVAARHLKPFYTRTEHQEHKRRRATIERNESSDDDDMANRGDRTYTPETDHDD